VASVPAWQSVVRRAHPHDHLVQIYTDDAFLVRTVVDFIGAGLAEGAAGAIVATSAHLDVFTGALAGAGIDVAGCLACGQLALHDARAALATLMREGLPDRAAFRDLALPIVERARSAGNGSVRLFGEMVDLLWARHLDAAVRLEGLWNEVLAEQGACLLCAYRIDNFDRRAHRGILHRISACHSHLIPADDYDRLDRAVDRACRDVFGPWGEARALRDLIVSRRPVTPHMPVAQSALFALRDLAPDIADAVLDRTRHHYHARH
jgi:DcmR-like sensory protein